ncbi:MAG: hypothetical protein KAJ14_10510 [Candidatus Omnitrophica bacterium]|nr:hypothetical protein [Candidatus Omnitrophota bacterium]
MKKIKGSIVEIVFICFIFCFNFITFDSFSQGTESLTITTFYPSPYGVFNTLRLFPTDSIDPVMDACAEGELYYDQSDQQIYVCGGTGSWDSSTGNWTLNGTDLETNDLTWGVRIKKLAIGNATTTIPNGMSNFLNISAAGPNSGGLLQVGGTLDGNLGMAAIYGQDVQPICLAKMSAVRGTSSHNWAGYFDGGKGVYTGNIRVMPNSATNINSGIAIYGTGTIYGVEGVTNAATNGTGVFGWASASVNGINHGVYGQSNATGDQSCGVRGVSVANSGVVYGVYGRAASPAGYSGYFTGAQGVYVNGNCYATTRTGGAIDVAEYISVTENTSSIKSGDVVIIDSNNSLSVILSNKPYDRTVAGIISTNPGYLLGVDEENGNKGDVKLTLAGRVPCKVTDEGGHIKVGDLLTTSSKPGYAMKAVFLDVNKANNFQEMKKILSENQKRKNAILGKALEPLNESEGVVMVLVTLQ